MFITNDENGSGSSFEAIAAIHYGNHAGGYHEVVMLGGFGATEEEAIKSLFTSIEVLQPKLDELKAQVQQKLSEHRQTTC